MKVLLEMRPALDGHAGIPQETRLLFRGLAQLPGIEVQGLIQSSNLVVDAGLPMRHGEVVKRADPASQFDRLSQVVVSLQQGAASHRFEHWRKRWLRLAGPLWAGLRSLLGMSVGLTAFDASHFKDFVWRAMFAKTLPVADFETVTSPAFRVLRWPWSTAHAVGVATATLGHAVYPRLDTRGTDMLLVETPYPGRVSRGTTLVVRYHDAIPLVMPHTVKDRGYHRAMHFHALRRNARDGAWFACVSEATRRDLLSVMPELEARTVTIPNMISPWFAPVAEGPERVPEIIWSRKNRAAPFAGGAAIPPAELLEGGLAYLLVVSTLEPRKNHLAVLDAWELLRSAGHPHLNLVFVGSLGWHHDAILKRLGPWLQRGGLHLLEDVPARDLALLYRHAAVTVCPSFGEGFDFAGVEAMRCGGVVAASDIPVHHDVYLDGCAYFSPYAVQDLAQVLGGLLGPDATSLRHAMVQRAELVAVRYLPEAVLPLWASFFARLRA